MAPRKQKKIYKGYLQALDIRRVDDDETIAAYWKKIKHNFFVLLDPTEQNVEFLNGCFKDVAKKFKGKRIKITIEEIPDEKPMKLPDPDEQYEGAEKFGRQLMSMFKIQ